MVRKVSSKEAREQFADIIGSVYYTKEPVIVERKGKPYAVLINPEQYDEWKRDREAKLWATVDRVQKRNAGLDPDRVYQVVTDVVEQVRQEGNERE